MAFNFSKLNHFTTKTPKEISHPNERVICCELDFRCVERWKRVFIITFNDKIDTSITSHKYHYVKYTLFSITKTSLLPYYTRVNKFRFVIQLSHCKNIFTKHLTRL